MATDMEVGLIGCGDMGKLYARKFSAAGYNVCVCDLPEKYESLLEELKGSTITVLRDGFQVSRRCDFIIYSVEAENIAKVVSVYGPATKIGAVVAGQTSVKEPEIRAFEKYLPEDVDIMTLHSLHGPSINPEGQALVVVKHRISDEKFNAIVEMCRNSLKSQIVHLSSYLEHDRITADTQAVTHLAFLSMGSAWKNSKVYPWRSPSYVGGIENVKMLMTLRIFSNKYHVYAGLAILNPSAQNQVRQYASSVTDLFKLIVQERKDELRERLVKAGEFVFGKSSSSAILLSDDVLKEFSLSQVPVNERKPNSHLSLLAMTDSWYQLKINPYDNLLCQTPLFRMWLGIVEYLFKNKEMFDAAIEAAISSKEIRTDDLEFAMATREWANMINESNFEGYKRRFLDASEFFAGQLSEGNKMSAKLIAKLRESGTNFPPAAPSSTISSLPPSPSTMPTSIKYIKAVLVYEDQDVYVDIDAKVGPPNKDCDVSAVFTFDEWKATRTKNGRFIKSTGEESLYRVSIFVTHIPKSTKMWFALKMIDFKNTSQEPIWDNNNYWNFEVVPDKLPQICLPSKQPPAPPAPPQATSPPPQFPPQNPPEKLPQICSPPKDTTAPKPIAAKPPIAPKPQYPTVTSPPPVLQTQQFQHPPHVPSNLIPQNSQFQQLLQSQQLSLPYQSQSLFSQPQSHSPFSQAQQSHSLFSQPHQSQSFFSQPHQSIFPSTQSFLPSPNSLFQHTTPTKTYQQSQQFPYQLTQQTTQLPITQLFQSSKSQPNFQLQSSHLQQQYQELQHYQKQKPIFTCQQQQAQQQNSLYSHQHDSRFYTAHQTPSIRSPTSPPPQPELSLQKPAQSRTSPKQKQLTMQQITLEITNTSWQYDEFFRDCFPDHSICSMMKGHRRIYDEFVLQH